MDSTSAILRLWQLLSHDNRTVSVHRLIDAVGPTLKTWPHADGASTLQELVWSYTQPDATGAISFLHFWAGMEDMLRVMGHYRTDLDVSQKNAVASLHFVRDCLLEAGGVWKHTTPLRLLARGSSVEATAMQDTRNSEDFVQVCARTLAGTTYTIKLSRSATVRAAKHHLAVLTNVPVVQQCLIHDGQVLPDEERPFAQFQSVPFQLVVVPLASSTQADDRVLSTDQLRGLFELAANVVGQAGGEYVRARIDQLPKSPTMVTEDEISEAILVWLEDLLDPDLDA